MPTNSFKEIKVKVFISWSKTLSKNCAELLKDWIKCTLQSSEPWISSKDIEKGTIWFNEISDQLNDTKVGIICLTKENKNNPWILFESGALAKGISTSKVITFLIDLQPSDIDQPLAQFNHTVPLKDDMRSLLASINVELGDRKLEDKILDQVFDTYWSSFEEKFNDIIKNQIEVPEDIPERSNDDILKEILYTTRNLDKRIMHLERNDKKSMRNDIIHAKNISTENELHLKVIELINNNFSLNDVFEYFEESVSKQAILDIANNYNISKGFKNNKISIG